jgi:hypothetical protein
LQASRDWGDVFEVLLKEKQTPVKISLHSDWVIQKQEEIKSFTDQQDGIYYC